MPLALYFKYLSDPIKKMLVYLETSNQSHIAISTIKNLSDHKNLNLSLLDYFYPFINVKRITKF